MAFISVLALPGRDRLRIVESVEPLSIPAPINPDGTFGDSTQLVVFQREVPETGPLLAEIHAALASARDVGGGELFTCPAPLAIRTIQLAAARLWPPVLVTCPECQRSFEPPFAMVHRMYLACPNCHNSVLNPRWDSA